MISHEIENATRYFDRLFNDINLYLYIFSSDSRLGIQKKEEITRENAVPGLLSLILLVDWSTIGLL